MKIKLRNFRCHTNAQYEIPDSGLVLIAGSSGSGKSSLLKAILYALFGTKAVRKPYSFGVTTCSVTLEFMGMKIHRTNRPNRVVVNDSLEDDAAQAYINEKLGVGYDEFMISSYIPQKNNSSVLSLAQSEQLRLIKTLAFEGEQNEVHKERLKEMIRESADILVEKRTETQFAQREVDRIKDIIQPIDFPLVIAEGETEDDTVEQYRERMRSFNNRMGDLLERKASCNEDLQSHVYAKAELDMTNEKLHGINTHLARITARHRQLQLLLKDLPKDLETKIEQTDLQIQYLELEKEHKALKEQYNQIQEDEQEERATQKAQIEHALWKHRGREKNEETARGELESYREQLHLWEQYKKASEKLLALQKELDLDATSKDETVNHYTELLEQIAEEKAALYSEKERLAIAAEKLALEKEIINCPECDAPLRWQDSTLVSVHDHQPVEEHDYESEIKTVEKNIKNLDITKYKYEQILQRLHTIVFPAITKTDPDVYEQMKQQIQMLNTFISQNKQREEELARIKRESEDDYLTPALKGIRQQIDEKDDEIKDILQNMDEEPTVDIATLREQLASITSQAANYQQYIDEMAENTAELEELRSKHRDFSSQIQTLKQQVAGINAEAIKKKITIVDRDIAKAKKKQAEDEELAEKVDQYLVYREQKKELTRWEKKLATISKKLRKGENVHTAHLTLKEKYIQAEIMALESTIHSINEHTRYYLDTFFADHQLSAVLEATHKGKKIQTLKINTAINYKGNEYDNISQMSGGEFDRCTLASICGINSMLGSPILILDESLASLDADTNTEIIRFLSELAQDKLILVCSHEAVRGIFDEIIEM